MKLENVLTLTELRERLVERVIGGVPAQVADEKLICQAHQEVFRKS